eukprot:12252885-Alexandrium_andersonii.AAC.1
MRHFVQLMRESEGDENVEMAPQDGASQPTAMKAVVDAAKALSDALGSQGEQSGPAKVLQEALGALLGLTKPEAIPAKSPERGGARSRPPRRD